MVWANCSAAYVFALANAAMANQELADAWVLEAQRFVGYWHGYGVRGAQLQTTVWKDPDVPVWVEPLDETDDCPFCAITNDVRVEERIKGFQREIDNEVIRCNPWMRKALYEDGIVLDSADADTRRAQLELAQERWPAEFQPLAYDFTSLPFYLKWRLCVRWNHLLRDWLVAHPEYKYNFDIRFPVLKATQETQDDMLEKAALAEDIAFANGIAPEGLAGEIAAEHEEGVW